jgi:alanine racemase
MLPLSVIGKLRRDLIERLAAAAVRVSRRPPCEGAITAVCRTDEAVWRQVAAEPTPTAPILHLLCRSLAQVEAAGFSPRFRHVSNTAAVLDLQALSAVAGLNLVRPGLMLYGLAPGHFHAADLRPVLTWKTGMVHLKDVPAGTPISYGGTFVTRRPSRIATLPVGYADGYDRSWGNRSHVLVRGVRAPVVGRVCMDLCMVDVTDVPGVSFEDEVVLLGRQGEGRVSVEELAGLSGTIPYEVLCGISTRVPREPVGG